jgi:hypothetical protein
MTLVNQVYRRLWCEAYTGARGPLHSRGGGDERDDAQGPRIHNLADELGHNLLGEELQLPLHNGPREEALLDPPDQLGGIAGLDHLREPPFDGVRGPARQVVGPRHTRGTGVTFATTRLFPGFPSCSMMSRS